MASHKVRRVAIPLAMDAALVNRAQANGVSVTDYIRGAIHKPGTALSAADPDAEV